MPEPYPARLLADSGVCTVEQCTGCDVVHVHIGNTTLRLKRAAFTLVCETLLSALSQVAPEVTVVTRLHGGPAPSSH